MNYEDLFGRRLGGPGGAWADQISDECRDWLEGLADEIIDVEAEPKSWREVHRRVGDLFPDDKPQSSSTIIDFVRHLVAKRG